MRLLDNENIEEIPTGIDKFFGKNQENIRKFEENPVYFIKCELV